MALLQLLREPSCVDEVQPGPEGTERLLVAADQHGVTALLAERLVGRASDEVCERLSESARRQAAWELGHRRVLLDALAVLESTGVEPILFKGTALAYSIYPNPVLRMRGDTDLIVPILERRRVTAALLAIGFECTAEASTGRNAYQSEFRRRGADDWHALDVHWRINDSEVLAHLFTYDELRADAQPLPALAPHSLAASRVHALLLACMHRAVHRHSPYYLDGKPQLGGNRLIWLYDIHLLAHSFTNADWQAFLDTARAKGLLGICAEGLGIAVSCYGAPVPPDVQDQLDHVPKSEAASRYLCAGPLRQQWLDWLAVPGAQVKAQYLRQLVLPPADYMRSQQADGGGWLPWLYLRRALVGSWRRLRGRVV